MNTIPHSLALPHTHFNTLQNTSTPDINLERDLIDLDEVALGSQVALASEESHKFRINISTIVISALIFLLILAWFDFLQTTFVYIFDDTSDITQTNTTVKLWYAFLLTLLIFILIYLIYINTPF